MLEVNYHFDEIVHGIDGALLCTVSLVWLLSAWATVMVSGCSLEMILELSKNYAATAGSLAGFRCCGRAGGEVLAAL